MGTRFTLIRWFSANWGGAPKAARGAVLCLVDQQGKAVWTRAFPGDCDGLVKDG